MKSRRFWIKVAALAFLQRIAFARADNCPLTVTCSIDGQMMMQEAAYYNGSHKSIKYGHDYYGPNGKEHHFVITACD
jgi:hypothetical protein